VQTFTQIVFISAVDKNVLYWLMLREIFRNLGMLVSCPRGKFPCKTLQTPNVNIEGEGMKKEKFGIIFPQTIFDSIVPAFNCG